MILLQFAIISQSINTGDQPYPHRPPPDEPHIIHITQIRPQKIYKEYIIYTIIYKFRDEIHPLIERWSSRQGQQKAPQILTEAMVVKICQFELGGVSDADDWSCVP
jgi:hypothetical protein